MGAVLAEQHDEWTKGHRYLTFTQNVGAEALPTAHGLEAATGIPSTGMTPITSFDGSEPIAVVARGGLWFLQVQVV